MAIGGTSISNAFGDIGGAVSDLFSSAGATQSAASYRQAEAFSKNNAALEGQSTAIQLGAAQRKIYQTISGQQADVAGAGFSAGGSAEDLLRDSTEQGALTRGVLQLQGSIKVNQYNQEAAAEESQAQSADTAAQGDIFGSILKIGAAALSFL